MNSSMPDALLSVGQVPSERRTADATETAQYDPVIDRVERSRQVQQGQRSHVAAVESHQDIRQHHCRCDFYRMTSAFSLVRE